MALVRLWAAVAVAFAPLIALAQGDPAGASPDRPGVGALWAVVALVIFGGALWLIFRRRPPREQTPRT